MIQSIPNLVDLTSYLPKNFSKKGDVDYTSNLQKGIDENRNVLLPNFPLLINDKGLNSRSGSIIVFNHDSKLVKSPTALDVYKVLNISNCSNVKVYFPHIKGDRFSHLADNGEWGFGISITKSVNISIYGANIYDCWGDGIYINNATNLKIEKTIVNNNRRNGISLISGTNIFFDGIIAANTNGTLPQAGIDIEPNNNNEIIENITINNLNTYNNHRGLLIAMHYLSGKNSKNLTININNHTDISSDYSFEMDLDKKDKMSKNIFGSINITNSNWSNPRKNYMKINHFTGIPNKIKINIYNINQGENLNLNKKIQEINSSTF